MSLLSVRLLSCPIRTFRGRRTGICCCSGILEPDTGRNGSLQVSVDAPVHTDRKGGS